MSTDVAASEPPQLPKLDDFSPEIVGGRLKPLLQIVQSHAGNAAQIDEEIGKLGTLQLAPEATRTASQRTRLYNVRLSLSHVGLTDPATKTQLTDFGRRLLAIATDAEVHKEFARHLLTEHYGWDLIEIAKTLRGPGFIGPYPGDDEFLACLRQRTDVSTNRKDFTKIRQWLQLAGVVRETTSRADLWRVDEDQLAALTGLTSEQWEQWMSLRDPQRRLLRAIHQQALASADDRWVDGKTVKRICEAEASRNIFPDASFRSDIVRPLVEGGWIEEQHRSAETDHGGNVGKFRATDKLMAVVPHLPGKVNRLLKISAELLRNLRQPLPEVLRDLRSDNTDVKGKALEILALKLAVQVDLVPFELRFRDPSGTGDGEVDLVADRTGLHYSRWVFQCKNVGRGADDRRAIRVGVLANEVGLAEVLKAHVVVVVTTGKFGDGAAQYVRALARSTSLQILLIDGNDLEHYAAQGPSYILSRLEEQARYNCWLKRRQLLPADDESVSLE
jgi:hypothetical protein